jgi:hypothetical protein
MSEQLEHQFSRNFTKAVAERMDEIIMSEKPLSERYPHIVGFPDGNDITDEVANLERKAHAADALSVEQAEDTAEYIDTEQYDEELFDALCEYARRLRGA